MRIFGFEICSYKPIIFGDLIAKQFVLFEHKKLFGIIFFYFKGNKQDRFHTHAFNALSIKLFGTYKEGILKFRTRNTALVRYETRDKIFKYFPRNCYHSINQSTGCMTLLIQGPWKKTWKECKLEQTELDVIYPMLEGTKRVIEETKLTWHRKII